VIKNLSKSNSPLEGKDSREVILTVALELFTTRGYDGTSIDDIRLQAGFKSKASLYSHFKSKEDVADALMRRILFSIEQVTLQAYATAKNKPISQFIAIMRSLIEWALIHPQECVFHLIRGQQEKMLVGKYDFEGNQPSVSYVLILGLVHQLRSDYPVRQVPDAALLSMIFVLIAQAVMDRDAFGSISLTEHMDGVLEMCLGVLFSQPVEVPIV
jgi:AcrR family transcriptional regulator